MILTERVALVGAGPGDPGLLTIRGRELLSRADIVLYDALLSERLLDIAPEGAKRIYVGKRAGNHAKTQQEINELMVQEAKAGRNVVRLKGGDPYLFGRGAEEAVHLAENGIRFEVVPGVSAISAVPAAAGIPLTKRGVSSLITAVTCHEDPEKGGSGIDWPTVAALPGTLVLFMGMRNLPRIIKRLLENGRPANTPAAVIRCGTMAEQRSVTGTLENIHERVVEYGMRPPALVVVGEVVNLRKQLNWFEARPLFGLTIAVTRPSNQARSMCTLLTERGAHSRILPMIRVEAPSDPAPMRKAVTNLDRYSWVVFTSVNAVDGFFEALAEEGGDTRSLASCRIASVGSATETRLEAEGVKPDLIPERFHSGGLAEALCERGVEEGECALYPCSSLAPEGFPDRLREAGLAVERVEAYTIVPVELPEGVLDPPPDVITFASPSAATNFVDRVSARIEALKRDVVFASIGPSTTSRMKELELPVQIEAEQHTVRGLVDAIVEHFKPKGTPSE